jgi:hypothetical protein
MSKSAFVSAPFTIGDKVHKSSTVTFSVITDSDDQWRRARDLGLNVEFKKKRSLR